MRKPGEMQETQEKDILTNEMIGCRLSERNILGIKGKSMLQYSKKVVKRGDYMEEAREKKGILRI